MRVFNIDKNSIPYQFQTVIDDETYTFEINYNDRHDFFTLDLLDDEQIIIATEKLVYEKPLFIGLDYLPIPKRAIVPASVDTEEENITWDNFYNTIFLYILEGDDIETIS